MKKDIKKCLDNTAFSMVVLCAVATQVSAQTIPLDYDDYSFFEEPNYFELPIGTLRTNVLLDQTYNYSTTRNKDSHQTEVLGRLNWEGQTESTAVIGAQYDGHYFREGSQRLRSQNQLYVRDDWGTFAVGNVSYGVRADTRRRRGIGHAQLTLDDFYGSLDQDAVYYRYGWRGNTASAVVDREGRGEIGVNMNRPMDESAYRLSWRARRGDTTDRDQFDAVPSANLIGRPAATTYGTAVVGGYTYGSFTTDLQLGYERFNLKHSTRNANRYFTSAGAYYKIGVLTTSWEAMVGEYDKNREFSSAIGFKVDLTRGLNLNFGHNYHDFRNIRNSTFFVSTCYEF